MSKGSRPVTEHQVATPDGRTLLVLERGDPAGVPLLVHNGTPNSRLLFDEDVARAQERGIRLISYDRPGYGGSSRSAGRTVGDCAEDVRAIASTLGIDRLGVWGISGGGPHALACAALLPDLVPAVGVLASVAPWGADGLDYFAGMGELNVEDTLLILEDPVAGRAKCEQERQDMLRLSIAELTEVLGSLLTPVDAAAFTGDLAEHLIASFQSGLAPGSDGWWDDELAMLAPWGFEVEAIRTPVLLLHGRQDLFVPFAHGEWLADRIPSVEAVLTDSDGHLTLTAHHLDQVHDWLLEHTAGSAAR
jgi:pimeloyl-ACP methyl ester carboxylesterase